MKKNIYVKILALVMVITSFALLFGCNKANIKYNVEYFEYKFVDSQNIFMQSGRKLEFNKDNTYTMVYNDSIKMSGTVKNIEQEKTLLLEASETSINIIKSKIKNEFEKLWGEDSTPNKKELLKKMLDTLNLSEEIHCYKNYMFSTKTIEAHKDINTEKYDAKSYSEVEGIYQIKNYEGLVLLKENKMFIKDPKSKIVDDYSKQVGTYRVSNDFITLTSLETKEGETKSIKYLLADYILPFNPKVVENSEEDSKESNDENKSWVEKYNKELSKIKGAKIKVLVDFFYSTDKI